MLGVSQPGNTPSSLRHSASFSCLQRGTAGEGHRARTSTLLQQPSLQLSNGHYQYTSSSQAAAAAAAATAKQSVLLQHHQQHSREPLDPIVQDGNDYGFVRVRPRLRSTNATLYHEEEVAAAKSTLREQRDAAAFSDRECDSNYRDCSLKVKDRDLSPKGTSKNQNPLRGALVLFTSTSSWWKTTRHREDQLSATSGASASISAPSSERKWSSTSMASPSNERKWSSSMTSPTNERKWSVGNSLLTSPSNDRKWNRTSVSSTSTSQQDRKWRSLGALLRAPTGSNTASSSHTSQNSLSHNMSVSMIEGDHFREESRGSNCKARYQQPTSYSARVSRVSRDVYRENGEFGQVIGRSKVSRRLYQDTESTIDRELDDQRHIAQRTRHHLDDSDQCRSNREFCRATEHSTVETRGTTSSTTRSSRAQSFYLLDDFLRPQPQQPSSSNKCMLNLYMSPSHAVKCGNEHGRSCEVRQAICQQQANVGSNITPPRRHNSSSDSLEVATSPLPPPVPPPPPQAASNARGDRERNENPKETSKDVCPCKLCWTNMQRSLVEEVSEVPPRGCAPDNN